MSGSRYRASTPVAELGRQLKMERIRARPGRPNGYRITEIPRSVGSKRTLERLEGGQQDRVNVPRVVMLCKFYETDPKLAQHIEDLAEATHTEKWWDAYTSGMEDRFWLYLQREDQAHHVMNHDSIFIPALLQHELYIDAIQKSIRHVIEGKQLDFDASKQLRLDRKRRWLDSGRRLTAIIGEAALLLDMGDDAMSAQRKHLLELAKRPQVEILVTPLSVGRHDAVGIEFSILEFIDGNESVIMVGGSGTKYVNPDSTAGEFFSSSFEFAKTVSIPIERYLK